MAFSGPNTRSGRGIWWLFAVLGAALTVGVELMVWVGTRQVDSRHSGSAAARCVVVAAPSPDAELHASPARCDTDPSFTVARLADRRGECTPTRYIQFRPPFADVATGRLCLVPNLVVGHCYRFGVPVGMWELAKCAGAGWATIKVTKRVDADDPHACPSDPEPAVPGIRTVAVAPALAYPSRTYCYHDPPGG